MSHQPQASVRESMMGTLPAGSLSAMESPPLPPIRSTLQQEGTQELLCLCVPMTPVCHPLVTQPCIRVVKELPHKRQTLGQRADLSSSSRLCSVSVEAFFSLQTTTRTYWLTQWYRFESWKPQTEMTVQNKKWVRVMTIEVFFLGRKCCLWVLCMNVLWETSKEHHSQFGIFQRMFQPLEGHPLQVQVGFYQSIVYIGKADRGKGEEWVKRTRRQKHQPNKSQGKNDFLSLPI